MLVDGLAFRCPQELGREAVKLGKTDLSQGGDLKQVQTSAQQQVAELDGLLLKLRRGGLLWSSRHFWNGVLLKGALTKGNRGFVA